MIIWDRCAICDRIIPVGELCYGIKNWRGDPEGGRTICKNCIAPENVDSITPPNEWVSVEERLPEEGEKCLLYTPRDGFIYMGFYDGNDTRNHRHKWRLFTAMRATQTLIKKVTHWMFLPEPPDRNPLKRGGDGR